MREALQIAAQTVARVQGFGGLSSLMAEEEQEEFEQLQKESELEEFGGGSHFKIENDGSVSASS